MKHHSFHAYEVSSRNYYGKKLCDLIENEMQKLHNYRSLKMKNFMNNVWILNKYLNMKLKIVMPIWKVETFKSTYSLSKVVKY